MKKQFSAGKFWGAALVILIAVATQAGNLQLLSMRDPSIAPPAGGGGDSGTPIISDDGRYVVFASTAPNLTTNRGSGLGYAPRWINVFVRDRVSSNTTLASVSLTGTSGNGDSLPSAISTNGVFVLFESAADNLVANDTNGMTDVFIRDLVRGTTTLVSARTNGTCGNGASRNAVMTPDGRYVVFTSSSSDLVTNDQNGIPDIFIRDCQSRTTKLVSVGAQLVNFAGYSESPEISSDGRYVAFFSTATNFAPNPLVTGAVYVSDLVGGNLIWASTNAGNIFNSYYGTTNVICCDPALSADGLTIAFLACTTNGASNPHAIVLRYSLLTGITDIIHTNASIPVSLPEDIHNLDMTPDGRFVTYIANTNTCVFLWDAMTASNILINQNLTGDIPLDNSGQSSVCNWTRIDASGRYVVFHCSGTNLVANTLTASDNYYVRDVQNGITTLLNADLNGSGAPVNFSVPPAVSAQNSLVAFAAPDGNLVPNDRNRYDDIFVRDVAGPVKLVSMHEPTLSSFSPRSFRGVATFCLSTNGRFAAFACDADDVVPANTNQSRDVFVRDILTGSNLLVSANSSGFGLDSISGDPSISADGRYVAFTTFSTNCVAGDTNNAEDVFVRDLQAGTNFLVSISTNGGFGNADSDSPRISADGRYILFRSFSKNLGGTPPSAGTENLYLRDLQLHTNYFVSGTNAGLPSMTPDGRFIANLSYVGNFGPNPLTYVWDTQLAKRIFTNNISGEMMLALSPHGHWLACVSNSVSTLLLFDVNARTNVALAHGYFLLRDSLQFSDDERYLVFSTGAALAAADSNITNDVYLYDTLNGTNQLISRKFNTTSSPGGGSFFPAISPDGRFIAYTSLATNVVAIDSNNVADVFLFDRSSGVTILVSASRFDGGTVNNTSARYTFSADSQVFAFRSLASDLTANDFNPGADLYAVFLDSLIIKDTDSDGMDDAWEKKWFGTLARDGTGDFDGDGVSDLDEFRAGTDPTDPASAFKAELSANGQNPNIDWPLVVGKNYRVQFKDDLSDPDWHDLPGNQIVIGSKGEMQDSSPAVDQRFYRIVLDNSGN